MSPPGCRPARRTRRAAPGRGAGCSRPDRRPERVVVRQVGLGQQPPVYVDAVARRIDRLPRQRDDALDQVVASRPRAVVERRVAEHHDVALAYVMPGEERLLHQDPVVHAERRHHGRAGDPEGLERERPHQAGQQHRHQDDDARLGQRPPPPSAPPRPRLGRLRLGGFGRQRVARLVRPGGSASAGSAMPGFPADHLRAAHGRDHARNGLSASQAGTARVRAPGW